MLTFARILQLHMFYSLDNALHITLDKVINTSSHLPYVKLPQRVIISITICACGALSQTIEIRLFSEWTTVRIADKSI